MDKIYIYYIPEMNILIESKWNDFKLFYFDEGIYRAFLIGKL